MIQISLREWQIVSVAAGVIAAAGVGLWVVTRKRPTADELELERRHMLVNYGRIVDGMLLDAFQIPAQDIPAQDEQGVGAMREMLLYQYEISGVVYECSQDITALATIVDPAKVKIGMPCSIRYQPGSPENSILVAERWCGLREGVPVMWIAKSPKEWPTQSGQAKRIASSQ
ncbi:hypothetical protein [Acidicapsa acidisoli]|uniref:hypothetical protein n=1 Tax=Acidicapsa acidisoli TaxID=1615681 RepID=UPI0021DFC454|nr:hypothetical protein [Acidicapsa acidisoli]